MVYLLHFSKPFKGAKHYIGFTDNLEQRLSDHRKGKGARILAVAKENGIDFELVRTWEGDRKTERRLKNQKNAARFCPICNESYKGKYS